MTDGRVEGAAGRGGGSRRAGNEYGRAAGFAGSYRAGIDHGVPGDSNSFYRAFVDHYDALFGVDDDTLSRVSLSAPPGGSVLDVGCGTGGYVRRLLTMGFQAWGVDLSPEMIARAGAADPTHTDRYAVADMRYLDNLPVAVRGGGDPMTGDNPGRKRTPPPRNGRFDVVFSVGNTVSHLATYDEVVQWFTSVRHILREKGVLIVQFVDVSDLAVGASRDLPALSGRSANAPDAADPTTIRKVTMQRRYTRVSERSIRFDATISVAVGEEYRTGVDLLLLYPEGVREMLSRAGFSVIERSGSWAPLFRAVV